MKNGIGEKDKRQVRDGLPHFPLPNRFYHTTLHPAMKAVPSSTTTILCGPKNAPSAPISFQSPAPRPRIKTKGSKTPKLMPAPSRDISSLATFPAPPQSQSHQQTRHGQPIGYFWRARQSSQPAHPAKLSAPPTPQSPPAAHAHFYVTSAPRATYSTSQATHQVLPLVVPPKVVPETSCTSVAMESSTSLVFARNPGRNISLLPNPRKAREVRALGQGSREP